MPNYGHIARNTAVTFGTGGYKTFFLFAPKTDFTALATPATTTGLGDSLTISTAHTFPATKGFFEYAAKTHSVTLKSTTVGEEGAYELQHSAEFTVIGDSASNQEQITRLLNDDVIVLLKDAACTATSYIQLGNDCDSPEFKVEFDGKTTKEGKKEYKVTVTAKTKYFYTATVTKAA